MTRFCFSFALLAVSAWPSAALAQLAIPPGTGQTMQGAAEIYDGLTLSELEAIVKEAGYTYARVTTDGKESIDATTKDGLRFSFYLDDCDKNAEPRCMSLSLNSFLFNETPNVTLRGVNEWNRKSWAARAVLYTNGTSGMLYNLGVDGGVTKQWLLNRFGNFDYYIKSYSDFTLGVKPFTP